MTERDFPTISNPSNPTTLDAPIPLEEVLKATTVTRQAVVGLPASRGMLDHRFPLTPEGAGMLVARGFRVKMERGAAEHIHYSDEAYTRCGVEIVERSETFAADIIVYLPALDIADARMIKRGSLLLTFLHVGEGDAEVLRTLLRRHVIALALELLTDDPVVSPLPTYCRKSMVVQLLPLLRRCLPMPCMARVYSLAALPVLCHAR